MNFYVTMIITIDYKFIHFLLRKLTNKLMRLELGQMYLLKVEHSPNYVQLLPFINNI
jgi:hypothetical protein